MLRQLLHRLLPALHTDFIAVELSDTFRSLSQRIEAMKHYRTWSRRQMALAGSLLTLLAAITIVPWRVVAQEEKPAAKTAEATATDKSKTDKPAPKTPQQLLIGAWRAGNSGGKLTFHSDGTYDETTVMMTAFSGVAPPNITGGWKIHGQELVITPTAIETSYGGGVRPDSQGFTVLRLDESLLRLKRIDKENPFTVFFRRVTDLQPLEAITDKLSPEVLAWAKLLKLDSEEAVALDAWNKQSQIIDKASLELIERLDAAHHDKIDEAKLFQFTADEAKAYQSLAKITTGGFRGMQSLADEGLLTADELGAVKRMVKFGEAFDRILRAVNPGPGRELGGRRGGMGDEFGGLGMTPGLGRPPRIEDRKAGKAQKAGGGRMGDEFGGGPRPPLPAPSIAPDEYTPEAAAADPSRTPPADAQINPRAREEALTKVNAYLQELASWLYSGPFK